MITWAKLIECIRKLEELPNGAGTEVSVTYKGTDYMIISYGKKCDIQKCSSYDPITSSYSKETIYEYNSLEELGKATDIGFSVEECWNELDGMSCEPDFDYFTFDEIYEGYKEAYESQMKKRKK